MLTVEAKVFVEHASILHENQLSMVNALTFIRAYTKEYIIILKKKTLNKE